MIINKYSKKRLVIFTCLVLLLAGGGVWAYNRTSDDKSEDIWQDGVNYRPPTKEESAAGDEKKQQIVAEQDQQDQQQNTTTKKKVSVVITDAGQYDGVVEVRSFIPSYLKDGTCKLIFSQESRTFTRTTPGYGDVSSTVCPAVEVKVSDFPNRGDWQIIVLFESDDAKGQSEPKTFSVE